MAVRGLENAMSASEAYDGKSEEYFTGKRTDFIDILPINRAAVILEIGCGDGAAGAYAKSTGKCGRYIGVELAPAAAERAAKVLDVVHTGSIEDLPLPYPEGAFDVLIASEVLEHLVDPWTVLRRLRPLMKPGGRILASSPNIAHKSTFGMLLAGRWDLDPEGRMDRTHLRWFTPASYAAMFRDCGYEVASVGPLRPPSQAAKLLNRLTASRWSHLFISQIVVEALS